MKAWIDKSEKNNLLIVDLINISHRFSSSKAEAFEDSLIRTIDSLAMSYRAKDILVLSDKGKSLFRCEVFPEYKGNRDEKYKNQSEEEKEKFKQFWENYKKALEKCSSIFPTFYYNGVEADDLAAIAVNELKSKYEHIWLISTDGDWDLLLDKNVSRFSFVTRKEYTIDNFYDNHNCDTPQEFLTLKVLMGDLGDNIRGVEGIGSKRGYGIIREYGLISDILDNLPLEGTQKFIHNLNSSEDLLERNILLIDLESYCYEAVNTASPNYLKDFLQKIRKI